jgi:hypothetical protein
MRTPPPTRRGESQSLAQDGAEVCRELPWHVCPLVCSHAFSAGNPISALRHVGFENVPGLIFRQRLEARIRS